MIIRSLKNLLDLHHFPHDKMAFIVGPRQIGKTTLAQSILKENQTTELYYNWDDLKQKKRLLKDPYAFEKDLPPNIKKPLIVFDEIHKYPRWKNYLKGVYDRFHNDIQLLITGSGRLHVYKKGADSLLGRFFVYHLLPLTVGELLHHSLKKTDSLFDDFSGAKKENSDLVQHLMRYTGFPQPYTKANHSFLNRWGTVRKELIIRQDIRDLSNIRELGLIDHLMLILPGKIGSPLSLNSMCEDIGVTFKTIKNWIDILEGVYYLFSIAPYSKNINRGLKKEKKIYFWNWNETQDEGSRFENFIACHLKKLVFSYNDFGLSDLSLYYVRDKQKLEADFLILKNKKPWILIETKLSDQNPSKSLEIFMKSLKLTEAYQIIASPGIHFKRKLDHGTIHIISADIFLENLP